MDHIVYVDHKANELEQALERATNHGHSRGSW